MGFLRIAFAIQQVVLANAGRFDEPFEQIFAEAGRVRHRQSDVFVQVEHLDLRPINAGRGDQRFQKFKLRGAGGGNNARLAAFGNGACDRACGLCGGYLGKLAFVSEDF